ncbi:hypothetical protein N8D56_18035 [Devosia sp. A8/3-2]|nr:hypothetical protein N8D56_18035 [Devosia sp. A8/3-2]
MIITRILHTLITLTLALIFVPTANAAGEGTAVGVKPDAVARISSSDRILEVGSDVSVGELIITGGSGQVQIVFADATRLVVGPGSSLLIETYLLSGPNTAGNWRSMRWVAAFASSRAVVRNRPIRSKHPPRQSRFCGTAFDFLVTRQQTPVMLYEGALQLCSGAGQCAQLAERCAVGYANPSGAARLSMQDNRRSQVVTGFGYSRLQRQLLPDFRVSGAGRCREVGTSGAESINSSGGSSDMSDDRDDDDVPSTPTPNTPSTPSTPTNPNTPSTPTAPGGPNSPTVP